MLRDSHYCNKISNTYIMSRRASQLGSKRGLDLPLTTCRGFSKPVTSLATSDHYVQLPYDR